MSGVVLGFGEGAPFSPIGGFAGTVGDGLGRVGFPLFTDGSTNTEEVVNGKVDEELMVGPRGGTDEWVRGSAAEPDPSDCTEEWAKLPVASARFESGNVVSTDASLTIEGVLVSNVGLGVKGEG